MGIQELLIILLICLLVFGAAKLPDIARSLGQAIREFKKSFQENDHKNNS
jgi:TatA/E family protein of Tat protein translocase